MSTNTPCPYYNSNQCHSCSWLEKSYAQQLIDKDSELQELLKDFEVEQWLAPVASSPFAFRNKAKMIVNGTVDQPLLGILDDNQRGIDLSRCPLYADYFYPIFDILKQFIRKAQLNPYNIEKQKGELKYILLTHSRHQNAWMLRFVLRTETMIDAIRQRLTWLQDNITNLAVVSVNIQSEHKAIIEGEREIVLTETDALLEKLNGIPLYISPRSFFQTNTDIAEKLYATAAAWSRPLQPKQVWDLFCGIGCFGLHCTPQNASLRGIEITPEAINSATRSAHELGLHSVSFNALDVDANFSPNVAAPDLLITNPPRRGIGAHLCEWINTTKPRHLLYSSCNAETLAEDLKRIDNYEIERVQLFDMFPNTGHYEVLVMLAMNG